MKEDMRRIRKNIGIITTTKKGTDIKHAIEDGFIAMAIVIEQEEIPVRKLVYRIYFRGVVTGLLAMNLISSNCKISTMTVAIAIRIPKSHERDISSMFWKENGKWMEKNVLGGLNKKGKCAKRQWNLVNKG